MRSTFVIEDTEFGPGHVVVADGKHRRMLITKITLCWAKCIWFEKRVLSLGGLVPITEPCVDIFHVSDLTLDADQKWIPPGCR